MELRQLQCFAICADTGSITRAADVLLLNQSNVSRMIQGLEAELGTMLFYRTKKGLLLTPDGEQLYKKNQEVLSLIHHMKSGSYKVHQDIFTVYTFQSNYIASAFSALSMENLNDNVRMRLLSIPVSEIIKHLEYESMNMGFVYCSEREKKRFLHALEKHGLLFHPLCKAIAVLYVGQCNALLGNSEVTLEEIQSQKFFQIENDFGERYNDLDNTIKEYGLDKNLENAYMINTGYGINQMLEQTSFVYLGHMWVEKDGKTPIVPRNQKGYFNYIPLKSADGIIEMGYISSKSSPLSEYARMFLDELCKSLNLRDYNACNA